MPGAPASETQPPEFLEPSGPLGSMPRIPGRYPFLVACLSNHSEHSLNTGYSIETWAWPGVGVQEAHTGSIPSSLCPANMSRLPKPCWALRIMAVPTPTVLPSSRSYLSEGDRVTAMTMHVVSTAAEAMEPRGGPARAALSRGVVGWLLAHQAGPPAAANTTTVPWGPGMPVPTASRKGRAGTRLLSPDLREADPAWGSYIRSALSGAGGTKSGPESLVPAGSQPILWPPPLSTVHPVPTVPTLPCAAGHVPDHAGLGTQAPPPSCTQAQCAGPCARLHAGLSAAWQGLSNHGSVIVHPPSIACKNRHVHNGIRCSQRPGHEHTHLLI